MTTIIYDHKAKKIACDSRELCGYEIKSDSIDKSLEKDGVIYFLAGNVSDYDEFIRLAEGGEPKEGVSLSCSAIIAKDDGVYKAAYNDDDGFWIIKLQFSDSIGSGGAWALAAVDFGSSVEDAVKYAMTRDAGTGGSVTVYHLENKTKVAGL